MSHYIIDFFQSQNIHSIYFRSSATLLLLENVTYGQTSVKHPIRVKVSSLVVTFFNGMTMHELWYKRQEYLGTKKKVQIESKIYVQNSGVKLSEKLVPTH